MHESTVESPQEVTETTPSVRTQLIETIEGRRVRVEARDGKRFEGDLAAVSLDDRNVLLHDIEELPGGATASAAFVAEVDWIVPVDDESK